MAMSKDEVAALEGLVDITTNVGKLHYTNEVMSSLLAKINVIIKDDDLTLADMIDKISLLLEWYDMYQAGVFKADIVGTRLGKK
jgi:hypothetical protein